MKASQLVSIEMIKLHSNREQTLNGSIYEGDPMWNRTVLVWNRSRVNGVNPHLSESDPKRI